MVRTSENALLKHWEAAIMRKLFITKNATSEMTTIVHFHCNATNMLALHLLLHFYICYCMVSTSEDALLKHWEAAIM
jgi:hypothetical protein